MSLEIFLILFAVFILLGMSAFFSGSETALTAVSRARLHALEQEGNERARRVNTLLAEPERVIGTVLLGNNLVNILASALTTSLLIGLFGEVGVAYATIGMTVLVVIFSEVLPKTYAIAFPERIALAVAPVMQALIVVMRPAVYLIEMIVGAALKLRGASGSHGASCYLLAGKLLAVPAAGLLAASSLGLSGVYFDTVIVFAALPTATSAYILAVRMGGDGPGVAWLVSANTLLAMLTLPVWLTVALRH